MLALVHSETESTGVRCCRLPIIILRSTGCAVESNGHNIPPPLTPTPRWPASPPTGREAEPVDSPGREWGGGLADRWVLGKASEDSS